MMPAPPGGPSDDIWKPISVFLSLLIGLYIIISGQCSDTQLLLGGGVGRTYEHVT